MIYKAPILSDCTFFVYESHIDQQPVMVNGPTVNTHTRTSAACFEFLRMISFRRTFLSDYQKRMEKLSSQVGFMIVAWHWGQTHTHTHLESQGVHLFVRDFPRTLCSLLLRCPFIQLCLVQPEGGDFFLKDPCTNDNKEVLLLWLGVKIHFNPISRLFHTTPFGVNLLFGKWWPFTVRHHDDIMNVQSETLEQSHHSEQNKTFFLIN